jgi:glutamine synthetase
LANQVKEQAPWYGLEQEYTLYNLDKVTPLGWPKGGFPDPQGPYYCSIGADNAFGRDVAEAHLVACLHAGLHISGINGEVMPGQWEYQIGPVEGVAIGDEVWISRYIMHRVCERFGVLCSLHPKPLTKGEWNGAGCHHNFSTRDMRDPKLQFEYTPTSGPYAGKLLKGGFAKIIEATDKLGAPGKPAEHIAVYGKHNHLRLTGRHETASIHQYSYGVANRGCSIRIPRETEAKGYGYLEDRRPASNIDPYVTCAKLAETIILG